MKTSTALQLLNIGMAVGSVVLIGAAWSVWAAAVVLGANVLSLALDHGVKSLEAGGE